MPPLNVRLVYMQQAIVLNTLYHSVISNGHSQLQAGYYISFFMTPIGRLGTK